MADNLREKQGDYDAPREARSTFPQHTARRIPNALAMCIPDVYLDSRIEV